MLPATPAPRDAPLRTASRDLDAADARFRQLLEGLDKCTTFLRAAAAPLGVVLMVAVAVRVPIIRLRDPGADLAARYGAPGAGGRRANVYFVNRTHIIKQLRWPCTAPHHSRSPPKCWNGSCSLLHLIWWWAHAREQWLTYERLVALQRDNVAQAPETFALDHERSRIHQRRYLAEEYERPPRPEISSNGWPADELVALSRALEARGWHLLSVRAANALLRRSDRRLVVLDGRLVSDGAMRLRRACSRAWDAATAWLAGDGRGPDRLSLVGEAHHAQAPRVRYV